MKRYKAKIEEGIDAACRNWWKICLFILSLALCASIVIFSVWFTGVGIHSDHVDVTPAHVRHK